MSGWWIQFSDTLVPKRGQVHYAEVALGGCKSSGQGSLVFPQVFLPAPILLHEKDFLASVSSSMKWALRYLTYLGLQDFREDRKNYQAQK